MSERLQKILFIIGFAAVSLLLGYGLYRFFFYQPSEIIPPPIEGGTPTGTLPTSGQGTTTRREDAGGGGGLPSATGTTLVLPDTTPQPATSRTTVLSNEVVRAISPSAQGGVRSYNPQDGKFYRILDNGTTLALSDKAFPNVDQVTWGNRTDKAILSYPDGSKILYDFTENKQVTLPKHWEDFDFSPQDERIAAKSIGNNETNRFLVTANPDGTNAQLIEELGSNQNKVHVSWSPSDQIIAYSFTGEPKGFDQQQVLLVGKNHENFKGLEVEGRGFIPNWSPNGQNVLYSVYQSGANFNPTLWISGAVGDSINANRTSLELNTWADKCAWQNETSLVCAVPEYLPSGAGLQRAIANSIPDHIYRIDLSTGLKVDLGVPEGNPTIDQVVLAPDGRAAYLRDQNTGKLLRFAF